MPHFLISNNCIKNNIIEINDKELLAHLFQSLRVKKGETIKFITEDETVYKVVVQDISKKKLCAEILNSKKSERKLDINLCVLISILKPDAMHLAIENAVQAGAKEIYAVYSDNSAPKREAVFNKTDKWQKIAYESFKQCERADMPHVCGIFSFDEIFSKFEKENILIFAEKYDEYSIKAACKNIDKKDKILCVFGPEGGFSEDEFKFFKKNGYMLVTLGKLIFKAPNAITAGLFGVSQNA